MKRIKTEIAYRFLKAFLGIMYVVTSVAFFVPERLVVAVFGEEKEEF